MVVQVDDLTKKLSVFVFGNFLYLLLQCVSVLLLNELSSVSVLSNICALLALYMCT